LAVGDQNFQKKCFSYFAQLKKEKRTVILVSHDMDAVKQYCDRAILLHDGEVKHSGDVAEVTEVYYRLNVQKQQSDTKHQDSEISEKSGTRILSIKSVDAKGNQKLDLSPKDPLIIEITAKAEENLKSPTFGIVVENEDRQPMLATNTPTLGVLLRDVQKGETISAKFIIDNIYTDGVYWLSGAFSNSPDSIPREAYDRVERISSFSITGREMKASITHPKHHVELAKGLELAK
jgi:ABC-type glutathione transport system ATPase component